MITLNRVHLLTELKAAAQYASKRPVQPILAGLLLEFYETGACKVTATDLDAYYVSGGVEGKLPALSAVVNAKEIVAKLSSLTGITVSVSLDDNVLTIAGTGSSVKLNTLGDTADFPVPGMVTGADFIPAVTLTADMVTVLTSKLAPVADQVDIKSVLHAVCLKPSDNHARTIAAATDGSRLVTADFAATYSLDKPLLIPASVFEKLPNAQLVLTYNTKTNWLGIWCPDYGFDIYSRRIDGGIPGYESIMPPVGESQGYRVYDRKELIAACKAILKAIRSQESASARRVVCAAFVGLQVADLSGSAVFDLTGQSSDCRAIGLNPNYLLDWLTTQETDRVELLLTGAQNNKETHYCKPVMLLDDQYNDHGVRHLLMPVQVKSDWAGKHARSIEQSCEPVENAPAAPVRPAKRAKTAKPVAAKREPVNAAPAPVQAPENDPVVSAPCAHLRKLIRDHVLTCRDCKCVVAALK